MQKRPIILSILLSAATPYRKASIASFIGCLKLQVIFRKRATEYRALLRKMTYEDKASYNSTPPYIASITAAGILSVRKILSYLIYRDTSACARTHTHTHTHTTSAVQGGRNS